MADPPTHFFKFIRPGFKFNVSIPRSFLTNFNCGKCSKVILRRGRHEWSVEIDDGFFGDGWRKFVKENGVEEFDFVVFKHQGNMVFEFLVFDRSTCERECPNLSEEMDVEERLAEPDTIRTHRKKNLKKHKRNDYASPREKQFRIKKVVGSTQKKPTISTHNNLPYFTSTLKLCSFKKSILHLPDDFSIPNGLEMGEMILRDDKCVSWKVQLNKNDGKRMYIGCGFRAFLVANGLKKGDLFKFELVEKEKNKAPIVNFSCLIPSEEADLVGELKSYHIQQPYLYLPQRFTRSNGLSNKKKMILKSEEGERLWMVELRNYKNNCCYIVRGWADFCVANRLKEGDCFRLKVVNNGETPMVNFYFKKK